MYILDGCIPPKKVGELIIYLGDTSKHELDKQNTGFTWIYGETRLRSSVLS